MSLIAYLFLMILATLASAGAFAAVVMMINDPATTNAIGLSLFYGSLFLTVMGIAAIIGFIVRFVIMRKQVAVKLVVISFRQAFLIAFVAVAVLFLLSRGLFTWLNLLFLVLSFSAIEFLLITFTDD